MDVGVLVMTILKVCRDEKKINLIDVESDISQHIENIIGDIVHYIPTVIDGVYVAVNECFGYDLSDEQYESCEIAKLSKICDERVFGDVAVICKRNRVYIDDDDEFDLISQTDMTELEERLVGISDENKENV